MPDYVMEFITNVNPKYIMKWASAGAAVIAIYIYILYDVNNHDDVFLNKE